MAYFCLHLTEYELLSCIFVALLIRRSSLPHRRGTREMPTQYKQSSLWIDVRGVRVQVGITFMTFSSESDADSQTEMDHKWCCPRVHEIAKSLTVYTHE